jgi:hypothetical protein
MIRELSDYPYYEYADGPPDEDCEDYVEGCDE